MKRSKTLLALALAAVMLLSMLSLTSCDGKEVDDIDGSTPAEAFEIALQQLSDVSRYEARASIKTSIKVAFISIPIIKLDEFYAYSYDGNNEAHYMTEEGKEKLAELNEVAGGMLDSYPEGIWYIDGMAYVNTGSDKVKYTSATSPAQKSEYEQAVSLLLEKNSGEVQCYKKGSQYYFTITVTEESDMFMELGMPEEVYTVYLTEDGRIERIEVYGSMPIAGMSMMLAVDYTYDDLSPLTAPADADSYRLTNGYYGY